MSLNEKKVLREIRKDELSFLTHIIAGIFQDAINNFQTVSRKLWMRDINTILRLVEHRGISIYTKFLPTLDDILLDVAKGGRASFSGPFGSGHTPKLFRGLWRLVIDDDGYISERADSTAIFFIRTFSQFAKKSNITLITNKSDEEKINGYESIEENLYTPSKRWFNDDFHGSSVDDFSCRTVIDFGQNDLFNSSDNNISSTLRTIQEVGDYFSNILDNSSRWIFSRKLTNSSEFVKRARNEPFKHGPGATATTSRYTDKFRIKVIQPSMLNYLNSMNDNILTDIIEYSNSKVQEQSSKIVLVPKDSRGPRVIAAEPIANQFVQQAGYMFIKNYVIPNSPAKKSIDFSAQELSRIKALEASVSGNYATMDLSDASDRLSIYLIERLFSGSQSFLAFLHSVRTKSAQYKGRPFNFLKKFASQGNALTFPLQTLVYYIICCGVILNKYNMKFSYYNLCKVSEKVRVFGDDIIIPSDTYREIADILTLFQLKVNEKKSFSTGFFRESCGGDYYKGNDVTPLKIRRVSYKSSDGQQMLIDVSNEAFQKGLWATSKAALDFFKNRVNGNIPVPIIAVSDEGHGLKCYSGRYSRHLNRRWNQEYQTIQTKVWVNSSRNWRCDRSWVSRIVELNVVDISQPSWTPTYIQRSSSYSKMSWA